MAGEGTVRGTVVRWDDARGGGVVEAPGLPGNCWVPAEVVSGGGALRAGQVVDVDWTEPGTGGCACRATRAVRRGDLQATPGGVMPGRWGAVVAHGDRTTPAGGRPVPGTVTPRAGVPVPRASPSCGG